MYKISFEECIEVKNRIHRKNRMISLEVLLRFSSTSNLSRESYGYMD